MTIHHESKTTVRSLELPAVLEATVPADKTITRTKIALDDREGFTDTAEILASYPYQLPEDVISFHRALRQYRASLPVEVGEGGAGYRSLLYLSHLERKPTVFIKSGNLIPRPIYEDADLVTMSDEELLTLDDETSQYGSARITWDPFAKMKPELVQSKFKLALVETAIHDWYTARREGRRWQVQSDATIYRQAAAYFECLTTAQIDFAPMQSEDYCFARAFGVMTAEEGLARWPTLPGHESNRITEMELAINQATSEDGIVTSNDHRVVQAVALRFGLPKSRFAHPDCVAKSWPLFWEFRDTARHMARVVQSW